MVETDISSRKKSFFSVSEWQYSMEIAEGFAETLLRYI
jgi:hypothetical protein